MGRRVPGQGARSGALPAAPPENQSVLYRCIQEHFQTWLAHRREGPDDDGPMPAQRSRPQSPPTGRQLST
jgi:hypothetical protein